MTVIGLDSLDVPAAVVARTLKSNEVPYYVGMMSLLVKTVVDDVVIPATEYVAAVLDFV